MFVAASIRAPLACPSCSPPCSAAFSSLANNSAYVSAAAAIDDARSTQVQPAAASACAAKRKNCVWNGTNATCNNVPQYMFPTNATYCFHNAIPEWAAFGGLIGQMQAAGNATTGGDVWWQNPAVGRLRISGAAVDLESLTLATPFFLPTACLDGADLMAIAAELSGECRAERRVVYCNVGVQFYPIPQ